MESLNFDFLAKHDVRLVTLGGLAERYFRDNPSTAIVKLRQFAELMTKLVAAHHAVYRDERESFEETLRRLSYDRLIPKEAADIFHALRKAGNTAVHEVKGNHATALTALKFAWSLGIWFHRTYGRDTALFEHKGGGEFAFGCCTGHIWEASSTEATSINFSWDGCDEMTEICGDGSAQLQPDGSLHGEISYRHGDEYSFIARKWTSSTAC